MISRRGRSGAPVDSSKNLRRRTWRPCSERIAEGVADLELEGLEFHMAVRTERRGYCVECF